MRTFKEGGPISPEEHAACGRLADAIIDVAMLSAKRMHVSPYSRVVAFFKVAPLGAWEKATLERFWERYEQDKREGNVWQPILPD